MVETTSKLSIVLEAENKTDQAFKQIDTQLKSTNEKIKAFGEVSKQMAVVGTAAFAAIAGAVYTSVTAAVEAEKKMAIFNTTMDTMGKKGQLAKQALLDASKAAIKLGFDDEDTANSLAKLFQRTGDATQAIKLNNLAMDLARAKNIDLESAVNLVNLALSGSGRALMQYGIIIKDTASPMEALSILQEKVGGQAVAFADTFAGKLEALKVETDNVKEAIGAAFLPILTQLLQKIEPIVLKITDWIEKNPELTKNLLIAAGAVSLVVAGIGTLGLIIGPLTAGIGALGTVLGAVGAVLLAFAPEILIVAAVIAGLYLVIKNWDAILNTLKNTWEAVKNAFLEGVDKMVKGFQPLVDIFNMIVNGWKGIFGIAGSVAGKVGGVIKSGIDLIPGGVSKSSTEQIIPIASKSSGTSYNFQFNGDVNDKDALAKQITGMLNRVSSLQYVGGI